MAAEAQHEFKWQQQQQQQPRGSQPSSEEDKENHNGYSKHFCARPKLLLLPVAVECMRDSRTALANHTELTPDEQLQPTHQMANHLTGRSSLLAYDVHTNKKQKHRASKSAARRASKDDSEENCCDDSDAVPDAHVSYLAQ